MESKYRRESKYARDVSQEYFRPLKSFNYRPDFHSSVAKNKQIELAEKLSKEYDIHEGNILRLIMYADIAWSYATDSEIEFYYSDMTELADFEKAPEPIKEIFFRGDNKSILITNPYLIDELYYSMLDFMDFQNALKKRRSDTKKKRPSEKIIKFIATEVYNELTQVEKKTGYIPIYITGYIFGLYNIGIKKGSEIYDFIMNQKQHELFNEEKKKKGETTESYLQYLGGKMKRYINF